MTSSPNQNKFSFGTKQLCCVLAFLALFAVVFLWFASVDNVLPEDYDPEAENPISTDTFIDGFDAIQEQLNGTPQIAEPLVKPDPIVFSLDEEPSAFFDHTVTLTIKTADGRKDCDIYYTTDGSTPSEENGTWAYGEITLPVKGKYPVAYHFAAVAVYSYHATTVTVYLSLSPEIAS